MTAARVQAFTTAHRRTLAVLAPVLVLVSFLAWALSSPVGSSPDDDFHLASIWCQTDRPGICETTGDEGERRIPADVPASVCYAFAPEQSAACQGDELDSLEGDDVLTSTRGNFENLYPPVFYATMGLLAGDSLNDGVLLMRVLNALLYVGLLTAVVVAVPAWLRPPAVIAAAITAVPFGMFLVPSTNPSSWALLSATTYWVALLGLAFARGRRAVVLGGLTLLAALVGTGARADAALFLAMATLAVLVLVVRHRGARWWVYAVGAASVLLGALLFSTASQGGSVATGLPNDVATTRSTAELVDLNLLNAPALWAGMFGQWGLGWLDTLMPAATWVLSGGVFAALVFWGLSRTGLRKMVVVAGAAAALWLVPVVLLVQTRAIVGEHVQPRYLLPIAIMLAGFAALPSRRGAPRLSVAQAVVAVGALALAHTLALHAEIRRYVTGTDHLALNLDFAAEWWWEGMPGPNVTWIVGSLAFGGGLALLALLWLAQPDRWDLPTELTPRDEVVPSPADVDDAARPRRDAADGVPASAPGTPRGEAPGVPRPERDG